MDRPARVLGMLGGMAWPSTLHAYRRLNELVGERLGGVHSAPMRIWSADFDLMTQLKTEDRWDELGTILADAARDLERSGAEGLLLCTNTMHLVADAITDAVDIPLLHIADATAAAIRAAEVERVALLGTRYTMELPFLRDRLAAHGLEVVTPDADGRARMNAIVYDELVRGEVRDDSRDDVLGMVADLVERDRVDGVIAGCTEIELLIGADDLDVAFFPTADIHVEAAADWMLGGPAPTPPTDPHTEPLT